MADAGAVSERRGELRRALGLTDAVFIGLGSMIGAGVFVAIGPVTTLAGELFLVSLALAGLVAAANATSSAQLAARTPLAGGTYVYGRERLGETWGFTAGWAFIVGKTASCAALARTVALYATAGIGSRWIPVVAAATALTMMAVNLRGIERTARATRVTVAIVLLALGVVVANGIGVTGGVAICDPRTGICPPGPGTLDVLRAAGLLFFAFAGYARIATLGEEVRDPSRTIPRAILTALGITIVVYGLVGESVRRFPGALGSESDALADAVDSALGRLPQLDWFVGVGAVVAALGVLLSLLAGVSRTTLAMARTGDLPRALAHVHPIRAVPDRAELMIGLVVALLAATVDVTDAIGFSAFTVLLYYAITNAAACRLRPEERRWPRAIAVGGLIGCSTLAATLPRASLVGGVAVMLAGGLWFAFRRG